MLSICIFYFIFLLLIRIIMYFLISSGFTYCRKNLQDIAVDASYMTLYIQKLQFSYKMSFFEPIFAIRYYDQKNNNFLVITSICQIE